jgi:hypothetical protein
MRWAQGVTGDGTCRPCALTRRPLTIRGTAGNCQQRTVRDGGAITHQQVRSTHWSVHTMLRCADDWGERAWWRQRWRTTANTMERRVSCRDWWGSIDLASKMWLENWAKNIKRHVFFHWVAAGALPIQPKQ